MKIAKLCRQKRFKELKPWIKAINNCFWLCYVTWTWTLKNWRKNSWAFRTISLTGIDGKTVAVNKINKKRKSFKIISKDSIRIFHGFGDGSQNLLNNIFQILGIGTLGTLGVYHSLYNKYCPKAVTFLVRRYDCSFRTCCTRFKNRCWC